MIIGNGVDIIDNKRIERSLKIKGFTKRLFTLNEINQSKKYKDKTNYFAKRFAAKEAFVKSIGIGFRNNINFNDIEIYNNKKGSPKIKISQKIKNILKKKFKIKKYDIHLSLSDEKKHSIAFVILNRKK
ncbi:holo-ACP synthase [Candidatus Pelagibacter sp.]|nr:holo-ACP synthase [Candidatus Pelagibacter sp.]